MKIGYVIAFLIAGATLYLFAEAQAARTAAPAPAAASEDPAGAVPAPVCPAPADVLRIAHPCEGARLPYLARTFVFGSADPKGSLTINGRPVPVHPGGGFIAMVELSTGVCRINAELTVDSTTYTSARTVVVAPAAAPSPVSPLTIEYIQPETDCELLPGEELPVSCKGSPGMQASFTVDRAKGRFPMTETAPGMYRGVYTAGPGDRLKKSKIRVTLSDRKKGTKRTKASGNVLALFKNTGPVMAEITAEHANLRAGAALAPGDTLAYALFLPKGTQLRITGRRGNELRVRLSAARDAWVPQNDVRLLPEGTPPARAVVPNIRVSGGERRSEVRVPLGKRLPFEVIADDEGKTLDVLLFGAVSNTDMIVYASTGGAVEQVRWFQDDNDTYRLHIRPYPGRWWGYDARYEGNSFVFELRSPPEVLRGTAPLSGITVAVDPGHSPDTGAVGPTGLVERDANLTLALCLRDRLAAAGAKVVMTRAGSESVALYDRPQIAFSENADILVSVHNNALPDGDNPFEKNGYGVYYYHPGSRLLAKEIHAAYGERFGAGEMRLRDDGLYYDNLAIPRTTRMPSVLTESAYIIIPQEEAYLKSPAFQEKCADAITEGITRYVSSMCEREKPPAKPSRGSKKR